MISPACLGRIPQVDGREGREGREGPCNRFPAGQAELVVTAAHDERRGTADKSETILCTGNHTLGLNTQGQEAFTCLPR